MGSREDHIDHRGSFAFVSPLCGIDVAYASHDIIMSGREPRVSSISY